jgi:hypothetical protein
LGVVAEEASTERVRIRAADGVSEYQVCLQPADMRLTWRSVDSPDLHGSARVQDGPTGGSNLQVAVSAPDSGPDTERIRAFLAETMRHLECDVSDNFNAG